MAPEVGLGKPYNETSDVYSLALLFWEIMHLYQPYIGFSGVNNFRNEVWKGPQIRPMISKKVPFELKVLLERAWSPDLTKRPSASEFEGIVRTNCLALNKSMRVTHDKRRSTFVLVSGGKSTRNEKLSTLPVLTENNFQNDNAVES
jgi:serine/threonine protein kinase